MPARTNYIETLETAWQLHLAPRDENAPTVISTFAGCGGSSLGYSMAGFRELLAVEWDNNAVETFKLNFPDVPVYHGDICGLSVDEALQLSGLKSGELDVLDGSPPCQGFSTAGKRKMSDSRNQLFTEFVRLLRGLQPKVFVMENVSGMVKGKMKILFAEIMRELKASNYNAKAWLLNAMYFGVPQSRSRMIFIGMRVDLSISPSPPSFQRRQGIPLREIHPHIKSVLRSGRPDFWVSSDLVHPAIVKQMGSVSRSGYMSGGHFVRLIDDTERRPTLEEVKLIASYPLTFRFNGCRETDIEFIGNSVPPLFMKAIAEHVRSTLIEKVDQARAA